MTDNHSMQKTARRLDRQIALTRLGIWSERMTRAFWPAWTAGFVALAVWISGIVPPLWEISLIAALGLVALVFLVLGLRGFRAPSEAEARARLDATLPGRPLATLEDGMAVGAGDTGSAGVWAAHRARMAARLEAARAVPPDLRVSRRDPFALRYMAVLLAAVALTFGTLWRAPVVPNLSGIGPAVASGPAWEGWLEPPRHTRLPTLYLADIEAGTLEVPEGTRVILRLYGEAGSLSVVETVSGRKAVAASDPMQDFEVTRSGALSIEGSARDVTWTLDATPDTAPSVALDGTPLYVHPDQVTIPWRAADDYGVVGGTLTLALDPDAADRAHGLAVAPEPREDAEFDLALPVTGGRTEISEVFRDDLTKHPLAGMPVRAALTVEDAAGQTGTVTESFILPGRAFYDPVAAALIEQRRDLNWSRENRARVVRLLKAITWKADGTWNNPSAFLITRSAIRRLEEAPLTVEARDEIADMLWEAATRIEDGSLDSALARLREAQERLSEAIRQGASPEEIERLMAEMRRAMDDYTRQLAQQQGQDGQQQQQAEGDTQEVTSDMLDEMMRRIEELMAQGRTAEAQELLRQLQEMMENLQVTQGGSGGQDQPGEGQQAMDELRHSLREQQELSDEAFRDLQEQFDQQQGQQSQPGQQPGQGQQPGAQGEGQQPGPGQPGGSRSRPSGEPGEPGGEGSDQPTGGRSLAERQDALRRGVDALRDGLPGGGTEAGEAARDALRRAEDAMRDAERNLAEGDLGGALDDQSQAMDALRDGMQELGRALAGERPQPGDRPGEGPGGQAAGRAIDRDPLGRESGAGGQLGTDDGMVGEGLGDPQERARGLRDEIRRRSGERERPRLELDYLERLLDRF